MIVLDTSIALEVLLHTPIGMRHADKVFGDERHAPHFIDLEFSNTLRRHVRAGGLTPGEAEDTLAEFLRLSLERHVHTEFLQRIWQLRDSVSTYDASYVALAEALDAPLLTCDAKLGRAHGHHARVVVLS